MAEGMFRGAVIPQFTYGGASNNFGSSAPNNSGLTGAYKSAVTQQGGDYDKIMSGYEGVLNSAKQAPAQQQFSSLTPSYSTYMTEGRNYQSSPDFEGAMSQLRGFSQNGGFSDSDISNLRSRATGPIRSAYATALKEMNRRKSLQGGYSPNHGAVLAKFAREQSGLMSDKYTDINAALAEKVAANKLSAMQTMTPLALREQENKQAFADRNVSDKQRIDEYNTNLINEFNRYNSEGTMRTNEANIANAQNANNLQLQALGGMNSLYGTTPALVNTFGSQVLQDRNQTIDNNQQRASAGLGLISQLSKPSSGSGGFSRGAYL